MAPRLSRPPAAEAGPLQVGWASCGCSAGPRIQACSTQASRGSVGMVSKGCVGSGPGSGPGFGVGVGFGASEGVDVCVLERQERVTMEGGVNECG
jgi:hypothetical protein